MTPQSFPQVNTHFGPPLDMSDEQVATIPAFRGQIQSGSCTGHNVVVVAWRPSEYELAEMKAGKPVFISMLGGLAPHFLTTDFTAALNPA